MEIKPIRTKADYRAALKEIEGLMSAAPRTRDGDRLDVLVTLVEAWERKHEPMDPPDPIEAIRFRMEQSGLTPKDLVPMIGRLNCVYEVLSRRRLRLADAPGNVLLPTRESHLPKDSVINVSQLLMVDKSVLTDRVSKPSSRYMHSVGDGIGLVLDL